MNIINLESKKGNLFKRALLIFTQSFQSVQNYIYSQEKKAYIIKYYGICTTNKIHSGVCHPTISSLLSFFLGMDKACFSSVTFCRGI